MISEFTIPLWSEIWGIKSPIELRLNPGYDDYLMDELVTVTGILRLKREDVSSGVYIMDKATAIKTEE